MTTHPENWRQQLDAQQRARATPPIKPPYSYRVAHVDGRITNHLTLEGAERSWRFGDVVYRWHHGRWAIWTSAGLF